MRSISSVILPEFSLTSSRLITNSLLDTLELSFIWLTTYEGDYFLPLLVKRLARIKRLASKIQGTQKHLARLKKIRSYVVRKYLREKKKLLLRLVMGNFLVVVRKGLKKKLPKKENKKRRGLLKMLRHANKKKENNSRVLRQNHVKALVREGLKESFFDVLHANEITNGETESNLVHFVRKSGFHALTCVNIQRKPNKYDVPLESFKKMQNLFAKKMQGTVTQKLSGRNSPFWILQKTAKTANKFAETLKEDKFTNIASGFWDMFDHIKRSSAILSSKAEIERRTQRKRSPNGSLAPSRNSNGSQGRNRVAFRTSGPERYQSDRCIGDISQIETPNEMEGRGSLRVIGRQKDEKVAKPVNPTRTIKTKKF